MEQRIYRIRMAILIPLGLDAILLFCLLAISFMLGGDTTERCVLALFSLIASGLFLEGMLRRIVVDPEGLRIRKPGRSKSVTWTEITHVGCLTLHRKAYLLLTTLKGFIIISSAYEGFTELVQALIARVEPDRVEEEVRLQAGRSVAGIAHVAPAWVAAALLVGIVLMKLLL
jgi:hypothetical protein